MTPEERLARLEAVAAAADRIVIGAALLTCLEDMRCFKDDIAALLELRSALAELKHP